MSLRGRLLTLFLVFLVTGFAGGAATLVVNAREAVRAEMVSALELAVALVRRSETANVGGGAPFGLEEINALHLRHIRARSPAEGVPAALPPATEDEDSAPRWFADLIGVTPMEMRVVRPDGAMVTLLAEPWDEVAEVWSDARDLGMGALVLSVPLMITLTWAIDRALRPLRRFEHGLERLIAGDYAFGLEDDCARELRGVGSKITRLARALERAEAENRRLGRQLVGVQDAERRELARELHDELGAVLFGMRVDAGRIAQLVDGDDGDDPRSTEIADRADRVLTSADALHRLSRDIMIRLRPPLLDQVPLCEALEAFIATARRQQPEIDWRHAFDGAMDRLEDSVALTVYRLVQEGVTNARRHGAPTAISVTAERDGDRLTVTVTDDGRGVPETAGAVAEGAGFGLSGMAERVRALGGTFSLTGPEGGGTRLTATLPLIDRPWAEEAPPANDEATTTVGRKA